MENEEQAAPKSKEDIDAFIQDVLNADFVEPPSASKPGKKRSGKRKRPDAPPTDEELKRKERAKIRRKKIREKELELKQQTEEAVAELINGMSQAVENDITAKNEGKFALGKLRLLPKVEALLRKQHYHEPFLNNSGCQVLAAWLRKHSDGSYPCLNVVNGMLDVLDLLPIEPEHLRDCKDLGRNMMEIYQGSDCPSLKVKAKKLIDKWCRMIFAIDLDYQNLPEKEENFKQFRNHILMMQKSIAHKQASDSDEEDEGKKTIRPDFGFIRRPVSSIDLDQGRKLTNKGQQQQSAIMKRIMQVKRESRTKKLSGGVLQLFTNIYSVILRQIHILCN
eukprot:TRINITY_DN122305_c0_g1_i1.p1 TRINITY_DN122305_c0_g1~~TRINITY_DN122305_c0_g1_i1.p1  ORF type:complete len:375 (-),score=45.08 TRINITY_DN122305_c0_g1_i1:24-1028(-)